MSTIPAVVFDGKKEAEKIAQRLKAELARLAIKPKLIIVAVDPDKRSEIYIKAKLARAEQIGIQAELARFELSQLLEVEAFMFKAVADPTVHGLMVQLPLPAAINKALLTNPIPPIKDVDGLRFEELEQPFFAPATVAAVLKILDISGIKPGGKKIVIVGQGEVGRPLSKILTSAKLKVITTTEATTNLTEKIMAADILISCVGKANLIPAVAIKKGAVVIDVGLSIVAGKAVGDVDFMSARAKAAFITPPTGGVGPMTVVMLMQNVIRAARLAK